MVALRSLLSYNSHFMLSDKLNLISDRAYLVAGIGSVFLVAAILSFLFFRTKATGTTPFHPPAVEASPSPTPEATPSPGFTVLLMGRGGAGHDGGALTDTMLLVRILEEQKKVMVLSLPRDLWVPIPYDGESSVNGKLNSAYAIGIDSRNYPTKLDKYKGNTGGGMLAKDVVEQVTGLSVDRYITLDFSGFEQAIDTIGGVDITVERAFTDYEYPIAGRESQDCTTYATGSAVPDPASTSQTISLAEHIAAGSVDVAKLPKLPAQYACRYELLQFKEGRQRMDGKTALKFVRSRHSSEEAGDFSRSRRQQLLIQAVIDQLFSIGAIGKIPSFLSTLRSHIDTDMTAADFVSWLPRAAELRSYPTLSLTLTSNNYLLQGYTSDRQFALTPLAGEGNFTHIRNWIASSITPTIPLRYPVIEVVGDRSKTASVSAKLKELGFPTHERVVARNATTSASLLLFTETIDPKVIEKIRETAGVDPGFVLTAVRRPFDSVSTDLRILLPLQTQ